MSISLIGKDGSNIASTTNGAPVFTGDASAAPAGVGAVRLFTENDTGTLTGVPYLKSPETSVDYRLRVGMDTYLLDHTFSETALDTTRWRLAGVTTMTAAMSGGLLQLNASAGSTVSGNYVSFTTCRNFCIRGAAPLFVEIEAQFSAAPLVNQIIELGLFLPPASGIQPADGVWLQFTSAGIIGTLNYGGAITQSGVFPGTSVYTANKSVKYAIVLSDRDLEFWADDVLLGELNIPTAQAAPCLTDSLPVTLMQRNNGIVAASVQAITKVGNVCVTAGDMQHGKSFPSIMCGMGHMGYQSQSGSTMGSTALFPNAAAATTVTGAALSQTVTLATGLGGQVGITATVPGVDGFAFSYQNPVGSTIIPPRNLTITGVKIAAINIGAAVATTPTTISWSLAFGATGATIPSLAATETGSLTAASIKAYRRIPLGMQSFVVGALIGAQAPDVVMSFQSPVVVHPGEWVALVCKVIQGTATASQVIFVNGTFDSHFD